MFWLGSKYASDEQIYVSTKQQNNWYTVYVLCAIVSLILTWKTWIKACSKWSVIGLERCVKFVKVNNKHTRMMTRDTILLSFQQT